MTGVQTCALPIYSYFTIVDWSTQDEKGREAMAQAVFTYDVNGDGDILNVDAYAIAQ